MFPTWRYHRTKEAKIVHNREELEALGEGWETTPAAFEVKEEAPVMAAEEELEAPKKRGRKPKHGGFEA